MQNLSLQGIVLTFVTIFLILLRLSFLNDAEVPDAIQEADEDSKIIGYFGTYEAASKDSGQAATSLQEPTIVDWQWTDPPVGSDASLGVLFPNHEGNDPYWHAVRRGVCFEAKNSGVEVEILASDGYGAVAQHQQQFTQLVEGGADAIILASIHYRAMDANVRSAARPENGEGIPIVEVINDIHAPEITAKALVSFTDMGVQAGRFVLDHAQESNRKEITIAFLPGPINSGWAPESLSGFLGVVREFEHDLHILTPLWGSPEGDVQSALAEKVLDANQTVDYLVGNAVAAAEAVRLLQMMGRENEVTVVSTYYSGAIRPLIAAGSIAAAPSDQTELIGRLAVSMAIRLLDGEQAGVDFPFRAGPEIPLITADNVDLFFPDEGTTAPLVEPEDGRLPCR